MQRLGTRVTWKMPSQLLMRKIPLTFYFKLRRACRHGPGTALTSMKCAACNPSDSLLIPWHPLGCAANESDPLIDTASFHPPVNNDTIETGDGLYSTPGAECPAEATMWSQLGPDGLELVLTLVSLTGWWLGHCWHSKSAWFQSVWHVFTPYALSGVLKGRMAPSAGYISYVLNRKIAVNYIGYI